MIALAFANGETAQASPLAKIAKIASSSLRITSPNFANGKRIPSRFTCDGPNVNPALRISNVPKKAKSLAIIVEDPDAPGGVFTHWLIWNLPPDLKTIPENNVPKNAVEGTNSFHKRGYSGPCPPTLHRYFFKLFALDEKLNLKAGASRKQLEQAMAGHVIDHAKWMGKYARKK